MESAAGGSSGNPSLRTLMFNDKIDAPNLGDFLRVKEDNNNYNNNLAGLTLGDVLSNKRECSSFPVHSDRTLLDIIRDDPNSSRKTRKWEHFRNKLRLRPAADAWTSNISSQQRNNPIMSHRLSHDVVATYPEVENFGEPEISASESRSRILGIMGVENENVEEEESEGENAREEIGVELEDQPVRMSLMALLTENDGDGSAYVMEDEDEGGEEKYEEDDDTNGLTSANVVSGAGACGEYNNCCVCMVRHKGAAFIPCGHTFCRLCSRELWVQRGNCPLCNNFILEVLDIF